MAQGKPQAKASDKPEEQPQEATAAEEWPGAWPEKLPDGLYPRLLLAQAHGGSISKSGRNEHHAYDYVRAEDVIRDASKILSRAGLVAKVGPEWEIKLTEGTTKNGGRTVECEAKSKLTIVNPDDPSETIDFPIIGTGTDSPGDKAIYKAQTGGKKYAWQDALTLAFGDDPEDDSSPGAKGAAEQQARGTSGPPYGLALKDADKALILHDAAVLLSTGEGPHREAAADVLKGIAAKAGYFPRIVADAIHGLSLKLQELDPELAEKVKEERAQPAEPAEKPDPEDAAAKEEADQAQAASEAGDPPPPEDETAPQSEIPADMEGLGDQPKTDDDEDIPF